MICDTCNYAGISNCGSCRDILKYQLVQELRKSINLKRENENLDNGLMYYLKENDMLKNSIKMFTNNANEHIERLETENHNQKTGIEKLKQELEEIKAKIILSEDNANRKGGKPLPADKIQRILELREKGFSIREVAKSLEISVGVVFKYGSEQTNKQTVTNV